MEIIYLCFVVGVVLGSAYVLYWNYIASGHTDTILTHIETTYPIEHQRIYLNEMQGVGFFKHLRHVMLFKDYRTLYPKLYKLDLE